MTSETRTLIELGDILGMELECPDCQIVTFYPIRMESVKKLAAHCSHCNHLFFDMATTSVSGPDAHPALASIFAIIGNLSRLTQVRTDIHTKIRLRIDTESTEAKGNSNGK
jgi:hypothetical protein